MRKLTGVVTVLSFLVSGAAIAAPNYNFIELDYVDVEIGPGDGDGWAIGGSGLVHPNIYLLGRYTDLEDDESGFDLEVEQISLGAGVQSPLQNDNVSVFGQLTYEDFDAEARIPGLPTLSGSDSGFAVEGGARFDINPMFEINGAVRYIDVSDFYDGEFGFRVGALWNALPWLAVSLDYDEVDAEFGDVEQLQLGARVYWDRLQ